QCKPYHTKYSQIDKISYSGSCNENHKNACSDEHDTCAEVWLKHDDGEYEKDENNRQKEPFAKGRHLFMIGCQIARQIQNKPQLHEFRRLNAECADPYPTLRSAPDDSDSWHQYKQ